MADCTGCWPASGALPNASFLKLFVLRTCRITYLRLNGRLTIPAREVVLRRNPAGGRWTEIRDALAPR